MCIIAIKDKGVELPNRRQLKMCWDNNPDGAGYMFPSNEQVVIKKGFMDFHAFYKSIVYDYKRYGKDTPFIMHFRISTQGGVNKQCCHPFPLSRDMEDLKKLNTRADIGIAHNGIIDLTSEYWGHRNTVTYSDTMKFITDYLTLIIKDKYFYLDDDTMKLIYKLAESRLAIMDGDGHISIVGDFITDKETGMVYSNDSYKTPRVRKTTVITSTTSYNSTSDWEDDRWIEDNYIYDPETHLYKPKPKQSPTETTKKENKTDKNKKQNEKLAKLDRQLKRLIDEEE